MFVTGGSTAYIGLASLRQQGYEADAALTGHAGLTAAAQQPPALVLLSLYLPDIGGIEVIRRIRRTAGALILALAGQGQTGDLVAALDAGADDCITKPFSMDEVHARLRVLLRRASWSRGVSRSSLTAPSGAWPQRIR